MSLAPLIKNKLFCIFYLNQTMRMWDVDMSSRVELKTDLFEFVQILISFVEWSIDRIVYGDVFRVEMKNIVKIKC